MTDKEVQRIKHRLRYATDSEYRERAKERAKRYRQEHPDKVREYARKYALAHPIPDDKRKQYAEAARQYYKERLATDPEFARKDKRRRMEKARRRAERYRLRYATDAEFRERCRQKSRDYQKLKKERMADGIGSTKESNQEMA